MPGPPLLVRNTHAGAGYADKLNQYRGEKPWPTKKPKRPEDKLGCEWLVSP